MKKLLLMSLVVATVGVGFAPSDADAKRLGGARSSGMQREMPARQTPQSTPPQQQQAPAATPATAGAAAAAAPAAAAAGKRSWMGPIAGLAAGLGIAALMSHLGMGEQFANFLMLALLAVVAIVAVRFLMARLAANRNGTGAARGMQFAGAGLGGANPTTQPRSMALPGGPGSVATFGSGAGAGSTAAAVGHGAPRLPAGFDAPAFERIAKMIFIRMQAANDAGDMEDLRQFATPEMFAVFRLDLQDRKSAPQKTDVVQLDAEVLDVAEEAGRQVVSVRFHGLVREEEGAPATPFDEVWHLVKPTDGSREWAIAGIGQNA